MKETFANRLKQGMELRGYKAIELAERSGLSRSLISKYVNGVAEARQSQLHALAVALDVSEAWLMGFDAPRNRQHQLEVQQVSLLGEISCGTPIFAEETFESYVAIGASVQCDFALRAKGDSMIGARICDGDIVFIRKQSMVNNGDIAAVIIDDEATLKRVYLSENKLVLAAENPAYAPLVFVGAELENIRILGKAVAFQSDVR